ncbi:3-octaprenyl-4-hydroxybenzoate carboxy-lyase [Geothermobacter hydrogeniphilus]|uniref:3-octaprenyl-4-hydroxybenzoate carboxy-lyase n=1 Tax=Geothermobacter hydrogeniphilus TaxID=1969733 RepID=A0A2K2H783_9BACT|nr:UbiD family decarboxylase [Geothermobacter hydrogeniphilus]PNU19100.1 3-octaprenyl-4-hydroxybenzoate carboxy-lyase [Geothermobacter hydrogeniphilus]
MGYRNLQDCIADLERRGELIRIEQELDPRLEIGAVQRRVYRAGGPALLFTRPRGSRFPMLGNLFGTLERTRWLFRDALRGVETLVRAKIDPRELLKSPSAMLRAPLAARHLLPKRVRKAPILAHRTELEQLPQLVSWPRDGGAFITLPQVYSEDPFAPGWRHSNLGMYRVQISGNDYDPAEAGMHYQIHRGIAIHHRRALEAGQPLRVNVFVGGPPALSVAAVMPLPEGMPEIAFAGLLGGRRIDLTSAANGLPMPAEADFCLSGWLDPAVLKKEGPFGDHLGYYSLGHEFPVFRVETVHHRPDAIWPFTTVGRPPQEDTSFGAFIHELTGELIPEVLPGVHAVHAVDAAGVHPLLLAVGSERYTPYAEPGRPQELLTQANAILGQGQLSLAKYLLIANAGDNPPELHRIDDFLRFMLERVDWRRDLHFQTRTTIDTLDYSGRGLNRGSKLVVAAVGKPLRRLSAALPKNLRLPDGFSDPTLPLPGVLAVRAPAWAAPPHGNDPVLEQFCRRQEKLGMDEGIALVVLVDDPRFVARSLDDWLWTVFTRSDPAVDIDGLGADTLHKHWGCTGPLVIDARLKAHHAPPLEELPEVEKRVDELGGPGGPLHGIV